MATTVPTELDTRPSYLAAGIATALVFLLYLVTLGPTTAMWDTSEYIAAAYVLGLPHPRATRSSCSSGASSPSSPSRRTSR
jgi:hypothetical protein